MLMISASFGNQIRHSKIEISVILASKERLFIEYMGSVDWETKRPRFVLIDKAIGRNCLGGRVWEDEAGRTSLGDETILFRPH